MDRGLNRGPWQGIKNPTHGALVLENRRTKGQVVRVPSVRAIQVEYTLCEMGPQRDHIDKLSVLKIQSDFVNESFDNIVLIYIET